MDCENRASHGRFIGDLCSLCHAFITMGEGAHSQAYFNARNAFVKALGHYFSKVAVGRLPIPW